MRPKLLRAIPIAVVVTVHGAILLTLLSPPHEMSSGPKPPGTRPPIWITATEVAPLTMLGSGRSPTSSGEDPMSQAEFLPDERSTEAQRLQDASPSIYFESDQLDKKAEPVGDWEVDARVWPSGLKSVRIEIWVDDEGHIERWNFLDLDKPSPELMQFLHPLPTTLMNPAWRRGKPVHSRLRIELFLDA